MTPHSPLTPREHPNVFSLDELRALREFQMVVKAVEALVEKPADAEPRE